MVLATHPGNGRPPRPSSHLLIVFCDTGRGSSSLGAITAMHNPRSCWLSPSSLRLVSNSMPVNVMARTVLRPLVGAGLDLKAVVPVRMTSINHRQS